MSIELTGLCRAHSFESATALCQRCGLEYCDNCVVFPFGEKKPLCKECAVAMSGVRSNVTRAAMSPRLVRKRTKAFAKNAPAAAAAPLPEPEVPEIVDTTTDDSGEPEHAFAEFDMAPIGHHEPIPGEVPPPPTANSTPAEGVAPAVDWNNPFG